MSPRVTDAIYAVATFVIVLAVWEATLRLLGVASYFIPAPSDIAVSLVRGRALYASNFLTTLGSTLAAFAFAFIPAVALGTLVAEVRFAERTLYPLLVALQSMPRIALAPIIIVWFGFGPGIQDRAWRHLGILPGVPQHRARHGHHRSRADRADAFAARHQAAGVLEGKAAGRIAVPAGRRQHRHHFRHPCSDRRRVPRRQPRHGLPDRQRERPVGHARCVRQRPAAVGHRLMFPLWLASPAPAPAVLGAGDEARAGRYNTR